MSNDTRLTARIEKLETETRRHLGDQDEYIEEVRTKLDDRMTRLEKKVVSVDERQERLRNSLKQLRHFVRGVFRAKLPDEKV